MVKIVFKTLKREVFDYDLALDSTVDNMKQLLHKERSYPLAMKLVFAGKVLSDNTMTLEKAGLGANKTVVIAAEPVKIAEAPKSQPAPTVTTTSTATPSGAPAAAEPTEPTIAPSTTEATAATEPNSELLTSLMGMTGADADKVKRALALAQNNPDVAAELLFSGRPLPDPATLTQHQQQAGGAQPVDAESGGLGAEQMELVNILRQPQFMQMREEVLNNSEQLEPLLEQLGTAKPEILRLINKHQDLFLEFLYGGMGGAGDGRQVVQVTPEEKAAIERLEQMGFRRDLVLQAYFACEKDENLAAEFLLSQKDDWS